MVHSACGFGLSQHVLVAGGTLERLQFLRILPAIHVEMWLRPFFLVLTFIVKSLLDSAESFCGWRRDGVASPGDLLQLKDGVFCNVIDVALKGGG